VIGVRLLVETNGIGIPEKDLERHLRHFRAHP